MKPEQQKAFDSMAKVLDDRQSAITAAREIFVKYGKLPDEYKHLHPFIFEKPWRESKKTVKLLKKAAKLVVKNKKHG